MAYSYQCKICGRLFSLPTDTKDSEEKQYCPACYEALQASRQHEKEELNSRPSLQITKHGAFADPDTTLCSFECDTCKCEWDIEQKDCDLFRDRHGKLIVSCKCPECLSTQTRIVNIVKIRATGTKPQADTGTDTPDTPPTTGNTEGGNSEDGTSETK